jgi:SAM-dependent methyltransferase
VSAGELHLNRERAGSFGSIAQQYDRYRPTYPEPLFDDLAALDPTRVLDVGCGTGKVGVALARRGLSVLGVDLDERMADVARAHGLAVEVAAFETWDDAGRQFDLITCADAWHWIDPDLGVLKVARVLRAGGTLARFWSSSEVDEAAVAALDAVYRKHAPEVAQVWRPTRSIAQKSGRGFSKSADPFADNDAFSSLEVRHYLSERTLSADEWVGLAATISDHQRLGVDRLSALLQALHAVILSLGGTIHTSGETHVLLARRAVD